MNDSSGEGVARMTTPHGDYAGERCCLCDSPATYYRRTVGFCRRCHADYAS